MGYYSDAALVLSHNGLKYMRNKLSDKSIIKEIKASVIQFLNYANKHYVDKNNGAVYWYWNNIKWYDDDPVNFPDICFMAKLMNEIPQTDYYFIRIGEDWEDAEVLGSYYNHPFKLALSREIVIGQ